MRRWTAIGFQQNITILMLQASPQSVPDWM